MLDVKDVSLSYGRTAVLRGLSFPKMTDGSLIGILGPNGAGKSTFLRAVAGQAKHEGSIRFNGTEIAKLPHRIRTQQIGFMPQSPPIHSGFVAYELVVSACRAARPDLSATAVSRAAETVFDQLQLNDLAFRPLNRMSGGQRQLVGLAQILVRDPSLLLLDEPSSALDLKWQVTVFEILRRRIEARGGLCLVALHDLNLALRHCDTVVVLGGGRRVAYGHPATAVTPAVLRDAYDVDGRVETCSRGSPVIIVDGIAGRRTGNENTPRKAIGENQECNTAI